MTTSAEQINDLIQAGNDWKAQADALLADRVAHQQAYAALSSNLKGVVNGQMYFVAYVDPDEAAPTLVDNGSFSTIAEAVNAAPYGSFVDVRLVPGKTHVIAERTSTMHRFIYIQRNPTLAVGVDPIVQVDALVDAAGLNQVNGFGAHGGEVRFKDCTIQLPDKLDPAAAWSAASSLYGYSHGSRSDISFYACNISGVDGTAITSVNGGGTARVGLFNTTLDGPFVAVKYANHGSVMFGTHTLTLSNGAALFDAGAGTVGVNILQN